MTEEVNDWDLEREKDEKRGEEGGNKKGNKREIESVCVCLKIIEKKRAQMT